MGKCGPIQGGTRMRFSEDKLAKLTCSDQVKRPIHIWSPTQPRAVILAIHGGMAHAGDFVTPALYFRQQGIATVSFDMHGHDGKEQVDIPSFDALLDDVMLFLKWVKKTYRGLPIFIMGHSMGALIASHLEVSRFGKDCDIKGIILCSPYFVNAVKIHKLVDLVSDPLSKVFPKLNVPIESLTHYLTHDPDITARHLADEKDHIRATKITFRFATALLQAQADLRGKLHQWIHPVFAVVAGDDRLADSAGAQIMLKAIPRGLLEHHFYPDNFHENFNEINREEIFASISLWMEKRLITV
jgi:lysophospholipase